MIGVDAFLALCKFEMPLASPGPRCRRVAAGFPVIRPYPSAAPVQTPSKRHKIDRIPASESRALTRCISEVPGLAKQTVTPSFARVLVRLSAPFIVCVSSEISCGLKIEVKYIALGSPRAYDKALLNTSKIPYRARPKGQILKSFLNRLQLKEAWQTETPPAEHWPYHDM